MKKVVILIACLMVMGCGPSIYLKWGEVEFRSSGKHNLKETTVTKITKDGSKITLKIGSSSSEADKATLQAVEALKDAVSKIPRGK